MLAIAVQESVVGSYLKASVLSSSVVPEMIAPPATYIMPPITVAGTYPFSTGRPALSVQREPTAAFGSNSQTSPSIVAGLIWNAPIVYSLLFRTAKPPGRILPGEGGLPGQLSAAVNDVIVSLTGL
jgi:hypothetical protein